MCLSEVLTSVSPSFSKVHEETNLPIATVFDKVNLYPASAKFIINPFNSENCEYPNI
jgi:hypothetical protein